MLPCSCSDGGSSEDDVQHLKVALVLPLSSPLKKERYERIASWFSKNLQEAQYKNHFSLDFDWYDEDTIEAEATAKSLAARKDIIAIVGPTKSDTTDIFAAACLSLRKPLISPTSSSEAILRKYSVSEGSVITKPFLWVLTECDISQTQAVLSKIVTINDIQQDTQGGKSKIALLASGDLYGQTFTQWVPFQISCTPDKLELAANIRYRSGATQERDHETSDIPIEERDVAVEALLTSGAKYAICAMSNTADVRALIEKAAAMKQEGKETPRLFLSDAALSPDLLQSSAAEGLEGVVKYADPTTGFQNAYAAKYGELPSMGEPQVYDALLLTALAADWSMSRTKHEDPFSSENMQDALEKVTGSALTENALPLWSAYGMKSAFTTIEDMTEVSSQEQGIIGASGPLAFDKDAWTSLVCTVYMHWTITNGKFVPIDYTSERGSSRVSSMTAAWKTQTIITEIVDAAYVGNYKTLTGNQVLLVAASENKNGLQNYRHQADVLNMYQLLKKNGYTDSDIILIIADDIASRTDGEVKVSMDGENLYHDLEIDYKIKDITTADIQDILKGNATEALTTAYRAAAGDDSRKEKSPPVLTGDEHTNIFVFWSGHGSNNQGNPDSGCFIWDGKKPESGEKNFTTDMLYNSLSGMYANKKYRQLFLMVETCYALSVAQAVLRPTDGHKGIPGILAFMASNAQEESIADRYNPTLRTYMTNRFTKNVMAAYAAEQSDCTFTELYEYTAKNTTGSHVQIINAGLFGALSTLWVADFFTNVNVLTNESM